MDWWNLGLSLIAAARLDSAQIFIVGFETLGRREDGLVPSMVVYSVGKLQDFLKFFSYCF